MKSESNNKKHLEVIDRVLEREEHLNLNSLLLSFSQIRSIKNTNHIYNGNEKIPFKKRHRIYQIIFKKEFAET